MKSKRVSVAMLWLFLTVVLLALPGRCLAAETGAIELVFPAEAAGVEMTLYSVAEYTDDQKFQYHAAFQSCKTDLLKLSSAEEAQLTAEELAVLASRGGVQGVTSAVGADGRLRFTGLQPAYYLLVQTGGTDRYEIQKMLAPIPCTQEDGSTMYSLTLTPKYVVPDGAVLLRKTDDAGSPVEQAVFRLERKVYVSLTAQLPANVETGQDGGGHFYWDTIQQNLKTDASGALAVNNLYQGMYRFVETETRPGLILNSAPVYFTIEKAGSLAQVNGVWQTASGSPAQVTVKNTRTTVQVNKVDQDGKALSGARLVLKDSTGAVIRNEDGTARYLFTTTDGTYSLRGIPAGEYYLSELSAPEGYEIAADVRLTVKADAADAVSVTMVDEETEETSTSLRVTKRLIDEEGLDLMAESQDFYVALFSDTNRTVRVSDVKTIHFSQSGVSSVTFENLRSGTYYVGETDAYGELLETTVIGEAVCAAEYPDNVYAVTLNGSGQETFTFANRLYDLPDGYYYGGELTVTKRVLRNGTAAASDDVFYAAVFQDASLTERYGDVIELEMGGNSETGVTVPVSIGTDAQSTRTYYVAETDGSGNVLENSAELAFTVSVDQSSVTLSPQSAAAEVVITNDFKEDSQPTPSGSDNSSGEDSSSGTGSSTTAVRTGDDTPIGAYLALILASAAVLGTAAVTVLKKRKN